MKRKTVDDLLSEARARIASRLHPVEAHDAAASGAILIVDLRSHDERIRSGVIPGSLHVPRSVLEWRADPECGFTNPYLGDLQQRLVLVCANGCSSSFAAASLVELGYSNATDMIGGFEAWRAAGLPTQAPTPVHIPPGELPGMGAPELPSAHPGAGDEPRFARSAS
jgi:rhodanese-related sulfurtransferase